MYRRVVRGVLTLSEIEKEFLVRPCANVNLHFYFGRSVVLHQYPVS